jgi:prephenate dehydratase
MIDALSNGEVDAIVGAHASAAGGYTTFGERIARSDSNLYVIFERAIPFGCCVLANRSSSLHEIEVVYGGPASLPLARAFVARNMPQARCEHYSSSSAIASRIVAGDGLEAMLGTRPLAEQLGLAVLAENIDGGETSGNWWVISTRALLSLEPATIFVSLRARDNGDLGRLVSRLAAVGYVLSTISVHPTEARLLEFDYLVRLHGTGCIAEIHAAVQATPGARLAGAIAPGP